MKHIEKDPFQTRIEITNWIVLLLLVGIGAALMPWSFALSILVGGFISIVNFHWLGRDLFRMFGGYRPIARPPCPSSAVVGFFIRFTATAVVLYLLFTSRIFDIFGLALGLSVVVLNLMLTTFWISLKKNHFKEA